MSAISAQRLPSALRAALLVLFAASLTLVVGELLGVAGAAIIAVQIAAVVCILADLRAKPVESRSRVLASLLAIGMIFSPWVMFGAAMLVIARAKGWW